MIQYQDHEKTGKTPSSQHPQTIHGTGIFPYIFHKDQLTVDQIYHTWMVWHLFHAIFFRCRFGLRSSLMEKKANSEKSRLGGLVLPQNVGHHQVMPGMKNGWMGP